MELFGDPTATATATAHCVLSTEYSTFKPETLNFEERADRKTAVFFVRLNNPVISYWLMSSVVIQIRNQKPETRNIEPRAKTASLLEKRANKQRGIGNSE